MYKLLCESSGKFHVGMFFKAERLFVVSVASTGRRQEEEEYYIVGGESQSRYAVTLDDD